MLNSEVTRTLISSGVNYANKQIKKIPFFALTSLGLNAEQLWRYLIKQSSAMDAAMVQVADQIHRNVREAVLEAGLRASGSFR